MQDFAQQVRKTREEAEEFINFTEDEATRAAKLPTMLQNLSQKLEERKAANNIALDVLTKYQADRHQRAKERKYFADRIKTALDKMQQLAGEVKKSTEAKTAQIAQIQRLKNQIQAKVEGK